MQLSEPSGATVDARGAIDDAPAVREGETEFVVATLDGTAVAGVDYTSTSGTLASTRRTRTTLAVPTLEDATAEETEGFTVQLSEPSGATVADVDSHGND